MESSDVELDLQRSVHAVLRELSAQAPALQKHQGMWRWSLHKKVERDPGKSPALVRILLRELEKAEREDVRHVIIPLLHTLMYVLTKATGITEELYRRTYAFCMKSLTLPAPYCTVALDCAIRLKTEKAVPGTLYQRLIIAEQNLRSELYPYQERVFLFVDPELISPSVCSALLLEIEAAQVQQTPEACMRHVVSHALQAALGEACHTGALQRKLQASPRRALERYFHAVVTAVEQMASEPSPSREGHLRTLEEIYRSLLGPAVASRGRCSGDPVPDRPPSTPLPSPHITFRLWTDEEQLWKELVFFLKPQSQLHLSADLDALDLQGFLPDRELARVSMLSTDSGIERDLPPGAQELPAPSSPEMEHTVLQRKGGIKKRVWLPDILMPSSWDGPPGLHRRTGRPSGDGELLPGVSRLHTARVLVLGDDRMLGRLARAYHILRKREMQMFCLTPRLSLQLYYIPVLTPEKPTSSRHLELGELAAFLGRADPWYESTINTLCPAIHKLAEMPPSLDTSQTVDPFILDVITYYVRMGTQPIYFQIYTVKIFFSDLSQDPAEDIFLTELKVKIQDSKFPKDCSSPRKRGVAEGPGAELSLCYQKALLSHRTREVTVSLRATGLVLKALPANDTEGPPTAPATVASLTDHMCLRVSLTEVVKSSNLAGRSFSMVTNTFRTASIRIQSQDQRLLTLLLDKDHRRTFRDVVRFEVAPCPEPCSGAQKSKALWLSSQQQKEMERTKAELKPLQMPINTFSGIVQ
ncbi:phosphoinositide-3-kinase regulatory subunit 6 [Rhinolophus ferrumequinum]|uniref:Phosphoinositide-3-kinase regulatory subunit 6 n=1 Tax=Rhinolophus ferrumequinum TaxID=59479 RepID=A0A7J7TF92_RHIFE|nr:phosphoinositide-3-kinase regulatory subunit 6 [Rhinolophus ferrumequinum]